MQSHTRPDQFNFAFARPEHIVKTLLSTANGIQEHNSVLRLLFYDSSLKALPSFSITVSAKQMKPRNKANTMVSTGVEEHKN